MRILYYSNNTSGHNRRFLSALAQSGHEIWFCDSSGGDQQAGWLPAGVRGYESRIGLPRDAEPGAVAAIAPEVHRMLDDISPDVVHAGPVQQCGYPVALAGFHPMLLMSWGSDILVDAKRDGRWTDATRTALEGADALFVDSSTVLGAAREIADVDAGRVVQFPWGVELDRFVPAASPRGEKAEFTLLCTRSWEQLYGIGTLLEGFLEASRKNPALRLILLGKGSMAGFVADFIGANGLGQLVRTPGEAGPADLPRWFQEADCYVSAALSDGTSVSMLEAMATALPVIVTDIPSNREWVEPGVNGWLAGTSSGFADAMLSAAGTASRERERIGRANRELVTARADWRRNFPRLLQMYDMLADR